MAAGIPSWVYQTLALQPEATISLEQRQVDFFVQDYFRLLPNVTLNGGLRLEFGKLLNAAKRLSDSFSPSVCKQQLADASNQCAVEFGFPFSLGREDCDYVVSVFSQFYSPGTFREIFGSGVTGLLPWFGLAWDLRGDGKRIIRAGCGAYESAFPLVVIDETRSAFDTVTPVNLPECCGVFRVLGANYLPNPWFFSSLEPPSNSSNGLNLLGKGANPLALIALNGFALTPVVPSRLWDPYSMQFNLTLEQAMSESTMLDIAYIGTLGRRLLQIGTPYGGPGARLSQFNPLAAYGNFVSTYANIDGTLLYDPTEYESSGSSSYNSLQVSLRQRLYRGVQGGLSFTWAHSIDNASDFFDTAGGYALPANSQDPAAERGNSAFDIRLRTSAFFGWQIPSTVPKWLTSGWQLFGIVTAQSGQPYTVNTAVDINLDGNATDRPLSLTGIESTGNRRVQLVITEPLSQWAYPSNGQPAESSVGRNTFRSSGLFNVDLALARDFVLPRNGRLTFRCDTFNVFNHTNFGIPVRIVESPAFGTSTNTVTPARSIQFGLKLAF